MTAGNKDAKRKRGVQASPAKLRKALIEAGIKTQAELAEKIADLEGLDNPPRGLVNKVFQGKAVDVVSLERVARALQTESWLLYKNSDEYLESAEETDEVDRQSPAPLTQLTSRKPLNRWKIFVWLAPVCVTALIAIGAVYLSNNSQDDGYFTIDLDSQVAVIPFSGPRGDDATLALEQALGEALINLPGTSALFDQTTPQEVLQARGASYVLSGSVEDSSPQLGIKIYAHSRNTSKLVWSGAFHHFASAQYLRNFMRDFVEGMRQPQKVDVTFPGQDALNYYIRGHQFASGETTEQNALRALTALESALRIYPNYVDALASLCTAIAKEGIRTGNTAKYAEAEAQCQRAESIDKNSIKTLYARGFLAYRTGQLPSAIDYFERVLQQDPDHVGATTFLIEVESEMFFKGQLAKEKFRAIEGYENLIRVNPTWQTYYNKARIHYFLGDLASAVEASLKSVDIHPNFANYANLGTFQFCLGDMDGALASFQAIKPLTEDAWVADYQLASVYFYLRDFEESVKLYQASVDAAVDGQIKRFQIWGGLGESLVALGETGQAADAFEVSLGLLEQAISAGDNSLRTRVSRLYAYLNLLKLRNSSNTEELTSKLREELESIPDTTDAEVWITQAMSWSLLGELKQAKNYLERAVQTCPGYAKLPNFDSIDADQLSAN